MAFRLSAFSMPGLCSALLGLGLMLVSSACEKTPSGPPATHYVEGEAFYLQKIALPEEAVLTVRLEDVTQADAPAVLISEQRIELDGDQQPFDFKLGYNLAALPEGRVYAVSGRIEDDSGLRFINTEQHNLLLVGQDIELRLKLDQVAPGGPAQALSMTPDFICRGNEPFWHLELSGGELQFSRLRDGVETRLYEGRFSRFSGLDGGAGYQWQGLSDRGRDSSLVAEISLDHCQDSMADAREGGDYDYRISLGVDDSQFEGCCNLRVEEQPPALVLYECSNDIRLSARFEGSGSQAVVHIRHPFSGDLMLPMVESASRYASEDASFSINGSAAELTLAGNAALACQVAESVVRYHCDSEQPITVRYQVNAQGGEVHVDLADGSELLLPQVAAASGARYAAAGNEFWNQGRAATLRLRDAEAINCTEWE